MRKYFDVFRFNLKTELNFKVNYFFTLFAYLVHVFILRELWDYILRGKEINGFGRVELVWYITLGEFMMYCINKKNLEKISILIKSGNVANLLTKPVSIIKYLFAEQCTSVVSIVINFIFAMILGSAMVGMVELNLIQVVLFFISIILSLLILLLIQLFIGLLAFITEENDSFYLVIQKAMLIVVFTPVEFFPKVVQWILRFLPSTYAIYPIGKIFTNYDFKNSVFLIICQIIALITMIILVNILNRKGVKKVNVNGG